MNREHPYWRRKVLADQQRAEQARRERRAEHARKRAEFRRRLLAGELIEAIEAGIVNAQGVDLDLLAMQWAWARTPMRYQPPSIEGVIGSRWQPDQSVFDRICRFFGRPA